MMKDLKMMKHKILRLKVEDYQTGSKSLTDLNGPSQLVSHDMPLKILDSIIGNEENKHKGQTIYNRGVNLKNSLIDANRVK